MGGGADFRMALATRQADHRPGEQNLLFGSDDTFGNDQAHGMKTHKLGLIGQSITQYDRPILPKLARGKTNSSGTT